MSSNLLLSQYLGCCMILSCNFSGFEVSPLSNTSLEIHLSGQVDLEGETNPQLVFIWPDIPAEAPKCERKVGPPGLWGVRPPG